VVPDRSRAGSDKSFYCRKRVFLLPVQRPERSRADVQANISANCDELRKQYWPTKFGFPGTPEAGSATPGAPHLPLTREEILFFFGHRELYCRANRPPTHYKLSLAFRIHHLFTVLQVARDVLAEQAKQQKIAKTKAWDRWWNPVKGAQGSDAPALEIIAAARNKVSFNWCYGAAAKGDLYPFKLDSVLQQGSDSPFSMGVPAGVIEQKTKSSADWLRCDRFRYSDEVWQEYDAYSLFRPPPRKPGEPAPHAGSDEGAKIVNQIGGLLQIIVDIALPNLSDALERVKDLSHISGDFLDFWMGQLKNLMQGIWGNHRSQIESLQAAIDSATTTWANAVGDAKNTAFEALKAAKDALQSYIKDKVNPGSQTIPGSGGVLVGMLDDLTNRVAERVVKLIEPRARDILSKGFKLVREVLDPIASEIIGVVASIPFVGSVLATAAQILYSWAMNKLEELAFEKLMGLVERLIGKGLRAVMGPVLKVAQHKILERLYSTCNRLFPQACPKDGKFLFAALPAKHQWLNRALACPGRPLLGPEVHARALAAKEELLQTGSRMRAEVALYGRDLADRLLANYGHNYSSWMAAVRRDPPHVLRAVAKRLQRSLRRAVARGR
jgi:hypothetical protein